MLTILNRDGEPNINVGLNFIGPVGTFREMPTVSQMNETYYNTAANYINNKSIYTKTPNGIWMKK